MRSPDQNPIGERNGIKIYARLKAKTPMKKTSSVKDKQIRDERQKKVLLIRCKGICERCKQAPDFRGLAKHERTFRSHGGNPLDPDGVEMLCGKCHSLAHNIHEV